MRENKLDVPLSSRSWRSSEMNQGGEKSKASVRRPNIAHSFTQQALLPDFYSPVYMACEWYLNKAVPFY